MEPTFSIYILPPILSLTIGLSLAVIAVIKAKLHSENILFSFVCIWWSLLSIPFICYHLIQDEQILLTIERYTHFFYVYIPAINILFFQRLIQIQKPYLNTTCFFVSFLISLTTFSDLYINGLYHYNWGYIAKGGLFFQIFGAYSMIATIYMSVLIFIEMAKETNKIRRIKIKYIVSGLGGSAFLTLLNIPAINGIDVYPFGNLSFIPLSFMAYGVLRYKILGIKTLLHVTGIWLMVSSLLLIPNYLLYRLIAPNFMYKESFFTFIILIPWFFGNFFYFRIIQPKIDKLFNKEKYNLRLIESKFIEDISYLKNLNELIRQFKDVFQETLSIPTIEFFTRKDDGGLFENQDGDIWEIDSVQEKWFAENNHLVERNMVETNPRYKSIRDSLIQIFDTHDCQYIVPVLQNQVLTYFLFMPEKSNFKLLSSDEVRFINTIRASASIALTNSTMYQNISNLKKYLEKQTLELKNEMTQRLKVEKEKTELQEKLEDSLTKVISGFIPICANCKNIRDDNESWNKIEAYIEKKSEAKFSHGICPKCSDELYGKEDWYKDMKQNENSP